MAPAALGITLSTILALATMAALAFVIIEGLTHRRKKLIPVLVIAFFIFFVALLVAIDVLDTRRWIADSPKLFLLELDGKIVAGVVGAEEGMHRSIKSVHQMDELVQKNHTDWLVEWGGYYRIFTVKWGLFENITLVRIGNETSNIFVTKDFILQAMRTEKTREFVWTSIASEYNVPLRHVYVIFPEFITTDATMRSFLLQAIYTESKIPLFKALRSGLLRVYPETITFKLIRWLPEWLLPAFAKEA